MILDHAEAARRVLAANPLFAMDSEDEQFDAVTAVIEAMAPKMDPFDVITAVTKVTSLALDCAPAIDDDDPLATAAAQPVRSAVSDSRASYPVTRTREAGEPLTPLVQRVSCATRMSDTHLAQVLGISRPTLNLWKNGHTASRFSAKMKAAMVAEIENQIDILRAVLDDVKEIDA